MHIWIHNIYLQILRNRHGFIFNKNNINNIWQFAVAILSGHFITHIHTHRFNSTNSAELYIKTPMYEIYSFDSLILNEH